MGLFLRRLAFLWLFLVLGNFSSFLGLYRFELNFGFQIFFFFLICCVHFHFNFHFYFFFLRFWGFAFLFLSGQVHELRRDFNVDELLVDIFAFAETVLLFELADD